MTAATAEPPRITITCAKCGKSEADHWPTKQHKDLCFRCSFWQEYVAKKHRLDIARICGSHFVIANEFPPPGSMRGHAGAKFKILFDDGREVDTTNLWAQGTIPDEFKDELPNNARFA